MDEVAIEMLAALAELPDAYGVPVQRRVSERLGHEVSFGKLYSVATELEDAGLIVGELVPTPADGPRGGRSKRVWTITARGRAAFHEVQRAPTRALPA